MNKKFFICMTAVGIVFFYSGIACSDSIEIKNGQVKITSDSGEIISTESLSEDIPSIIKNKSKISIGEITGDGQSSGNIIRETRIENTTIIKDGEKIIYKSDQKTSQNEEKRNE